MDVHADRQVGNVQPLSNFFSQASAGTLPSVSWISPDPKDSEHPAALVSTGQAHVTRIINTLMHSSDWKSSAIFLAWDDWGGFYDHVNPLLADILDVLDGSSLTAKDQAASPQTAALSPSELRVLRNLRPSHHSAERGVPAHRLPARTAVGGPLDGSPAPAQERGLDGQDSQGLRRSGRAFDRQCLLRPGTAERSPNSPIY